MKDSAWAFISVMALATGFIIGVAIGSEKNNAVVSDLEQTNRSYIEKQEHLEKELAESQQKYQELSYKYQDDEFEKIAAESAYPTDEDDVKPYEISEEEFEKDFNSDDCDSTSINYYVEDMIFTDEKDERITEPEEFLGDENVDMFHQMSIDDFRQVVYIRNASNNTVYEVIVENEVSYYRDVLGIDDGLDDD
uniref:Uncharacterized protein n=1 Tax=Siphoviridae sp. ctgBD49 TaxID=2826420 RepID=A0A8S5QNV8_9CAUD|nr:MAG TPA: Protein of unknown function (DUF1043) [Siphoviridae sp. ctgBD49]